MLEVVSAPVIRLPKELYAAPGLECNVYFGNVLFSVTPWCYAMQGESPVGRSERERWTFLPTEADAGKRYPLVINAWTDDGLAASATTVVRVASSVRKGSDRIAVALFGDSLTNCRWQDRVYEVMRMRGLNGYSPVGARRSENPDVMYDGYGGFTFETFLERYGFAEDEISSVQDKAEREQMLALGTPKKMANERQRDLLKSPILRFENGKKILDVRGWMERVNGGTEPDVILILLGVNGIFHLKGEVGELRKWIRENRMPQAQRFLDALRKEMPHAQYCFLDPITGCSQDGFAANYGAGCNKVQYMKIVLAFDLELDDFVMRQNDGKIRMVPFAYGIDPVHGYLEREVPANAHCDVLVRRQDNAIHCSTSGGKQLGDVVASWFLCNWEGLKEAKSNE